MLPFDFQTILLAAALLATIKFVLSYTNKRRLPPSPPALPFIGHLHLFKKPLHHTLVSISQRYGPIIFLRFGSRRAIVISSRSLAEECFTTHDLALADRPQFTSTIHDKRGIIVAIGVANYGSFWRDTRRIATVELLSAQRLHASSDVRAREVEDMACRLFQSWMTSVGMNEPYGLKKLELKTSLFHLSLNLLMTMIAGKRFYGENLEDLKETIRFREAVEEHFALSGVSNMEDYLPVLKFLDLNGVKKKKAHLAKQLKEMVVKLIEGHRKVSTETRKTMIAHLLELQEQDPEGYSDPKIESVCLVC
jgi:isoflavone/4'-methoxyisoflavone 2'-hydroxylase